MTDHDHDTALVNEYCRLAMAGAEPEDAKLVALRGRMSANERMRARARLGAAAEEVPPWAAADGREAYWGSEFGANDNAGAR
jgi:hypothetical protein